MGEDWEQLLANGQVALAAMRAALDALVLPAYVVRECGEVVHANAAGRVSLERDCSRTYTMLRDAVAGRNGVSKTATVSPIAGSPPHFLVHFNRVDGHLRSAIASRRWLLTRRQTEVLSLVAAGMGNKTIAAQLGCADRTVELHVTALLKKATCKHRSELVAKFWSEPLDV